MFHTNLYSNKFAKTIVALFAIALINFWQGIPAQAQIPGTWAATGSMNTARSSATATLLNNGKVLVCGGVNSSGNMIASAELYDPSIGNWTATGNMASPRLVHTATLLPDGRVLVAGGLVSSCLSSGSSEIYDPNTGVWTATGNMQIPRGGALRFTNNCGTTVG